jgi:ATP synthase protein I
MPTEEEKAALEAIDARIAALREARKPVRNPAADKVSAGALAWRMVTELVVGVLLGAAIGWGLDEVVGTAPAFLMVFGLLGFAAGVRTVMRSAEEVRRRDAADGLRRRGADEGGAAPPRDTDGRPPG